MWICLNIDSANLLQICNAVAVAKLLNATLIIPHFHLNSVWKDPRYVLFGFWRNRLQFTCNVEI